MAKNYQDVDLEKMPPEEENYDNLVVMSDEKGNETYFLEEMLFTVAKDTYAVLVEFDPEAPEENADAEEENAVIAKVLFDAEGEPEYVDPTDEEFAAALAAYERMMDETEETES